jgi:myo-inositol-1(or 4)-monophosphatase
MSADERVGGVARERLAADLVVRGGRLALEYFHRAQVSWKPDGSIVTDADLAIQECLAAEIARAFPNDSVIGEEGTHTAPVHPALYAWVIDPVDGTNNFGRGLPGFAVSIGVLRNGVPFAGAVYDPIARWLFTACAGRGAWLNDRPLHAGMAPLSSSSLIAIRTPLEDGPPPYVEEWLRRYRLRRFGSTALHLCYVAMGTLDFVHDHRTTLWHLAGAAPVVLEAGAVLTQADGSPLFPASAAQVVGEPITLLAGNRTTHAQAVADVAAAASLAR